MTNNRKQATQKGRDAATVSGHRGKILLGLRYIHWLSIAGDIYPYLCAVSPASSGGGAGKAVLLPAGRLPAADPGELQGPLNRPALCRDFLSKSKFRRCLNLSMTDPDRGRSRSARQNFDFLSSPTFLGRNPQGPRRFRDSSLAIGPGPALFYGRVCGCEAGYVRE